MKTNVKRKTTPLKTAEGAPAKRTSKMNELRRSVLSCLLWESEFYEDGHSIAERVKALVAVNKPQEVLELAIEAREKYFLRHMPLLLMRELARHPKLKDYPQLVSRGLARVIQRADEPAEFLSIYWSEGKCPVSKQVRRGLAWALHKFNEYELAKYNRDGAVTLRDVLFLTRPLSQSDEQKELWKKLAEGKLATPDTWEVNLSAGADKKETFTRMLKEGKLGYLALLRNLRNMAEVDVDSKLVTNAILVGKGAERVLPFRYIAASKAAPQFENALDIALQNRLDREEKLKGRTIILVDISGSMNAALSGKSDMTRIDAACGVAIVARALCDEARVFAFSDQVVEVPPRHGMALRDAIDKALTHGSTYLGRAVSTVSQQPHDRLIVITDEQAHDPVGAPKADNAYMINVASNRNGIGYGPWTHIDGFSEGVIRFIQEREKTKE